MDLDGSMDICRICLTGRQYFADTDFISIYSMVDGLPVDRLILSLFGPPTNAHEGVGPNYICRRCLNMVVEMRRFKDQYLQSMTYHYNAMIARLPPRPVYPGYPLRSGNFGESSAHVHSVALSYVSNRVPSSSAGLSNHREPFSLTSSSSFTGARFQSTSSMAGSSNANSLSNSAESSMQNINGMNIVNVSNSSESSIQIANGRNERESLGVLIANESDSILIDDSDDDDDDDCRIVEPVADNNNDDCFIVDDTMPDSTSSNQELIPNQEEETSNNDKLYYCSICKTKMVNNHDCFVLNKEFCTCLVPNCSLLFRSLDDFKLHYYKHMGIPSGAKLCFVCYREESNGHVHHNNNSLFKCYSCQINFSNMKEFVDHKIKKHKGRLVNSSSKLVCFYCETEFDDVMLMNEHLKHCREDQEKKSADNERPNEKISIPAQNLYTCTKYSCKEIFTNFSIFKEHYRKHFRISEKTSICWRCCKQFSTVQFLRKHQHKGVCCTHDTFKCNNCSSKFDTLHTLSVHKLNFHDGILKS